MKEKIIVTILSIALVGCIMSMLMSMYGCTRAPELVQDEPPCGCVDSREICRIILDEVDEDEKKV